jgi:N-acetylneuraminic acid mutarotase
MIIWGGSDDAQYLYTIGRYNPASDSWTPNNPAFAPAGRIGHSAIWTGTEMIVWGGVANGTFEVTNTGGRYNPSTDSWTPTSLNGVPMARAGHSGVWTGSEMIIWGGGDTAGDFNTGSRYNPGTNSWTPLTTVNAPLGLITPRSGLAMR